MAAIALRTPRRPAAITLCAPREPPDEDADGTDDRRRWQGAFAAYPQSLRSLRYSTTPCHRRRSSVPASCSSGGSRGSVGEGNAAGLPGVLRFMADVSRTGMGRVGVLKVSSPSGLKKITRALPSSSRAPGG